MSTSATISLSSSAKIHQHASSALQEKPASLEDANLSKDGVDPKSPVSSPKESTAAVSPATSDLAMENQKLAAENEQLKLANKNLNQHLQTFVLKIRDLSEKIEKAEAINDKLQQQYKEAMDLVSKLQETVQKQSEAYAKDYKDQIAASFKQKDESLLAALRSSLP